MHPKDADGMVNSVVPDQSDLGLHCLPRPVCLKTKDHYGRVLFQFSFVFICISRSELNEVES